MKVYIIVDWGDHGDFSKIMGVVSSPEKIDEMADFFKQKLGFSHNYDIVEKEIDDLDFKNWFEYD